MLNLDTFDAHDAPIPKQYMYTGSTVRGNRRPLSRGHFQIKGPGHTDNLYFSPAGRHHRLHSRSEFSPWDRARLYRGTRGPPLAKAYIKLTLRSNPPKLVLGNDTNVKVLAFLPLSIRLHA